MDYREIDPLEAAQTPSHDAHTGCQRGTVGASLGGRNRGVHRADHDAPGRSTLDRRGAACITHEANDPFQRGRDIVCMARIRTNTWNPQKLKERFEQACLNHGSTLPDRTGIPTSTVGAPSHDGLLPLLQCVVLVWSAFQRSSSRLSPTATVAPWNEPAGVRGYGCASR